jgi:hypothetical protein
MKLELRKATDGTHFVICICSEKQNRQLVVPLSPKLSSRSTHARGRRLHHQRAVCRAETARHSPREAELIGCVADLAAPVILRIDLGVPAPARARPIPGSDGPRKDKAES